MSKPCARREEVYLSFKRLDDGVQSKISGCLCNLSVCKPYVRVKGLRFGNAKRKAKSEECFYCAES